MLCSGHIRVFFVVVVVFVCVSSSCVVENNSSVALMQTRGSEPKMDSSVLGNHWKMEMFGTHLSACSAELNTASGREGETRSRTPGAASVKMLHVSLFLCDDLLKENAAAQHFSAAVSDHVINPDAENLLKHLKEAGDAP